MKKKTKLTIETERILIIRGGSSYRCAQCEACGELVHLITVDEAAKLAQIGSRAIYRMVEAESIHFIETSEELLLICFNSLYRLLSQAETRITSVSLNQEIQGREK
jgi:hypothetical protein